MSSSDLALDTAYGVKGRIGASSERSASFQPSPYMLQEEEKTKRSTPAAFAAWARRTEARWLMSYVQSGLRSPSGSFASAARWTTASKPRRSSAVTSDIFVDRRCPVVVAAEDTVAEECCIEARHIVALRGEVAGHDRADIALVTGDENAHQIASTSLWIGRVDCVVSRSW